MADGFSFEIEEAGLAEFHAEVERTKRRVMHEIARDAERDAPKESGEMAASIQVDEAAGEVSVGTDHWRFVEFGTRDMHAQPFMRPALYKERGLR